MAEHRDVKDGNVSRLCSRAPISAVIKLVADTFGGYFEPELGAYFPLAVRIQLAVDFIHNGVEVSCDGPGNDEAPGTRDQGPHRFWGHTMHPSAPKDAPTGPALHPLSLNLHPPQALYPS